MSRHARSIIDTHAELAQLRMNLRREIVDLSKLGGAGDACAADAVAPAREADQALAAALRALRPSLLEALGTREEAETITTV